MSAANIVPLFVTVPLNLVPPPVAEVVTWLAMGPALETLLPAPDTWTLPVVMPEPMLPLLVLVTVALAPVISMLLEAVPEIVPLLETLPAMVIVPSSPLTVITPVLVTAPLNVISVDVVAEVMVATAEPLVILFTVPPIVIVPVVAEIVALAVPLACHCSRPRRA